LRTFSKRLRVLAPYCTALAHSGISGTHTDPHSSFPPRAPSIKFKQTNDLL
jgi:hypothetical protein